LVAQEQVLGDEVAPVADGGSERRQQERKEFGHGHSVPVGTPGRLPVRTIAPLQPLLERLRAGELRAAIDVYEPEPPPEDSPWRALPNVVHTPHRAGATPGAIRGVFLAQCEEARRHFAGEPLTLPLRPELVALFEAPDRSG
jgi:hypothetical protein